MLSRWSMLAVGLLVQSVGGLMYAFALYSGLLKEQFGLSQEQTDLLSTVTLVGCTFGVHVGALYDSLGKRGPPVVLSLAVVLGLSGWIPIWAILHFGLSTSFAVLLVLSFCQGHSMMCVDITTVSTLVRNFSEHRGLVISLLKSYVGLSGALVGQVFTTVFKPMDDSCGKTNTTSTANTTSFTPAPTPNSSSVSTMQHAYPHTSFDGGLFEEILGVDPESIGTNPADDCRGTIMFLMFLGCEILLFCSLGASIIRQSPPSDPETTQSYEQVASKLRGVLYGTMALALLTAGSSFLEYSIPELGEAAYGCLVAVFICFTGVLVLAGTRTDPGDDTDDDDDDNAYGRGPREKARLLTKSINIPGIDDGNHESHVKDYTLGEAITTPWLWVIFFSFMLGGGSGLVVNANLAQIIPTTFGHPSFDSDSSTVKTSIFVTLFSVCNCFGRLLAGLVGDWLLKSRQIPRPAVFALSLAMMSVSMILMMIGTYRLLFPAIVLCGLAYGSFNALCPTLISELFGVQHFAKIYAFNAMSLATGSYSMATVMAGKLYAEQPSDDKNCTAGAKCFSTTFLICAIACGVMSIVMMGLARSTRKRYRQLYPNFFASKVRASYSVYQ